MSTAEITSGIYTCLEMLRAAGLTHMVGHWCNLLYAEDGECVEAAWSERNLREMEFDVIHYA